MFMRFLIYGFIGWGMEIIWTGINSFLKGDLKMTGYSSLWMFPIYGMAIFLEPFFNMLSKQPFIIRGGVYTALIFVGEFMTGWALRKVIGQCPWDYTLSPYNINGLIRLDFAPLWFMVGLFYERIFNDIIIQIV